jgi:hypothetical protein
LIVPLETFVLGVISRIVRRIVPAEGADKITLWGKVRLTERSYLPTIALVGITVGKSLARQQHEDR